MKRRGSDRRQLLKAMGLGFGVAATGAVVPVGCSGESRPEPLRVPLESVPSGGRLRVLHGENPVELRRAADGTVTGRSLWCTHFGCEVDWVEERRLYQCPCHDGSYDASGRPLEGPPPRPLAKVAVEIEGGYIVIGTAS